MKKFPFCIIAILIVKAAIAQEPNFSGTWIIKSRQYVAGPKYNNAIAKKIKVEKSTDSLLVFSESFQAGEDGKSILNRSSYPVNGKPSVYNDTNSQRKIKRSLSWSSDKKELTLTSVYYIPKNENDIEVTRVETWSLSPNGKQLYIDKKSIESRSETWQVTAEFQKEGI